MENWEIVATNVTQDFINDNIPESKRPGPYIYRLVFSSNTNGRVSYDVQRMLKENVPPQDPPSNTDLYGMS